MANSISDNRGVRFLGRLRQAKTLHTLLLSLFGVGKGSLHPILTRFGFGPNLTLSRLSSDQLYLLGRYIDSSLSTERVLKKRYIERVLEKRKMGSYKGIRHTQRLPVRGQRTRSNSKTVKRTSFTL